MRGDAARALAEGALTVGAAAAAGKYLKYLAQQAEALVRACGFDGYGENLTDCNHRGTYVGVGFSLLEWY